MAPKHSFIVPVYNVASYLKACLDSIQGQTVQDWECLCIDDGSTDGSGALLDDYAQRDVRFKVIHQANAGVSLARNVGLELAQGEWISFVDADDAIAVDYLETFLKRPEKAEINFLGLKTCFEDGSFVAYCSTSHGLVAASSPAYYKMIYTHLFNPRKGNIAGYTGTKIFCGELLRKHNIRFIEGLSYQEDVLFLLHAARVAKTLQVIPHVLYYYRVSTTGLTYQPFDREKHFMGFFELLKTSADPYLSRVLCLFLFTHCRIWKRMHKWPLRSVAQLLPYVKDSFKPSFLRLCAVSPAWLCKCLLGIGALLHRSPRIRFAPLPDGDL